jgi:SET domain-containing protein
LACKYSTVASTNNSYPPRLDKNAPNPNMKLHKADDIQYSMLKKEIVTKECDSCFQNKYLKSKENHPVLRMIDRAVSSVEEQMQGIHTVLYSTANTQQKQVLL